MCGFMEEIRKEAYEEGKARVNKLNSILIGMDRFEDLVRATKDRAYQMELMEELLTKEN